MEYPEGAPVVVPDRLRGRPDVQPALCQNGCAHCVVACPSKAILGTGADLALDMGRCLFCGDCERVCPTGAIRFTNEYRLAARCREDLILRGQKFNIATPLVGDLRDLFAWSFKLRQVSAGGCNACEADINVLGTIGWDLGRFGIQVVASPRHADALVVTGPVPHQMKLALEKTFAAVPTPRLVIAVGACAIAGGPFIDHPEVNNGASSTVPVALFIPGCPPHPLTILDGFLRLLGRLPPEVA